MKLKALVLFFALSAFSLSAFAQYFPAQVQVTVLPGQVAAVVVNPHLRPVICSGQVFGQTIHGPVFNAFFLEQVMPAGAHRYAYVTTDFRSPFLSGWANIHCRFINYWY